MSETTAFEVIVAGGGDLPYTLSYSEEGHPKEFRAGLMERYGIATPEELVGISVVETKFAYGNGYTIMGNMKVSEHPKVFVAISVTEKVPEVLYVCEGFCWFELMPSPNSQYQSVTVPEETLEPSV